MTRDWIDNKYRTIYEFVELRVLTEEMTVESALEDLKNLMGDTENPRAEERVNKVISIYKEVSNNGLEKMNIPLQEKIYLTKIKLRLAELN